LVVNLAIGVPALASGASTYVACEGNSSAVFKAEMKIRPRTCVALGPDTARTVDMIRMRWSRWNRQEAVGDGFAVANHGEEINGELVFQHFPIHVRLSRPAHPCDGSERTFTRLEVHSKFGSFRDPEQPDCP
jgi:hypothetical protein